MLNLKEVKLKKSEEKLAEDVLANWKGLTEALARLDLHGVRALLAYELRTRKRLTIVQRLTARYGVLEQRENEKEVARALVD